jgi:butyryl-CoA dehydrogenase
MWISGGDQDISENIVHMVLAKIPGGPPGVKGISLFIVPKYRVEADGSVGSLNNISLAGLNHKMGNRGTTNTLLNFGEKGECIGWIVGEPHKGLQYMFHMMNEARISVGHGAVMCGLGGYLYSLQYAKDRLQGRHPSNKDPLSPQVPIIEHTDIKRLLLAQKSSVEGGLALILYCASLLDELSTTDNEQKSTETSLLLDLLTPIAKSWPSEFCLEANKHAIQILGGYGYTKDYPVERFYRDNRLNPIHEGTTAMHAMDILRRKVRMSDGRALELFEAKVKATIETAASFSSLKGFSRLLGEALYSLNTVTQVIITHGDHNKELANANLYLEAFGHITIAWLWLEQAMCAARLLESKNTDYSTEYLQGKLRAMTYFYRYELPVVHMRFALLMQFDDTCLTSEEAEF